MKAAYHFFWEDSPWIDLFLNLMSSISPVNWQLKVIVEVSQGCCWKLKLKTFEFAEIFAKAQMSAKTRPEIDLVLQSLETND